MQVLTGSGGDFAKERKGTLPISSWHRLFPARVTHFVRDKLNQNKKNACTETIAVVLADRPLNVAGRRDVKCQIIDVIFASRRPGAFYTHVV